MMATAETPISFARPFSYSSQMAPKTKAFGFVQIDRAYASTQQMMIFIWTMDMLPNGMAQI